VKLSPRERKIVSAGAAVLVVTLGLYFGDSLFPARGGPAGSLDQKKLQLLQRREKLGMEPTYRARVVEYRKRLEADQAHLLPGDNPSIAAAELMRVMTDLAAQNGSEIQRKDIQREVPLQENLIKVSVKIEVNCTPENLVKFIAAVENYEKYLTLDELTITAFRIQKKYEIRPSLTIAGFILGPEVKPAEKRAAGS
jgi:Tfp pilus assembly protein PilO